MKMALFSHSDFDPGDTQEEVVHTDNEVANAWMDVTFLPIVFGLPAPPRLARPLVWCTCATTSRTVFRIFDCCSLVKFVFVCLFVCSCVLLCENVKSDICASC